MVCVKRVELDEGTAILTSDATTIDQHEDIIMHVLRDVEKTQEKVQEKMCVVTNSSCHRDVTG